MRDIRFDPKDTSKENGRIYATHSKLPDIDMVLLQSAMLAKRDVKRLNIAGIVCVVSFVLFVLCVLFL